MSPTDIALKIIGAIADLTVKAIEDARRGDAEALAKLEQDHAALEAVLLIAESRRAAWRKANDERLAQLEREQTDPDKTPVP